MNGVISRFAKLLEHFWPFSEIAELRNENAALADQLADFEMSDRMLRDMYRETISDGVKQYVEKLEEIDELKAQIAILRGPGSLRLIYGR